MNGISKKEAGLGKIKIIKITLFLITLIVITGHTDFVSADMENKVENVTLFQKAVSSAPELYDFAKQQGATISATPDGKSFYVLWFPPDAKSPSSLPVIVTLHGHASWALKDFNIWFSHAKAHGYGLLVLQWWFGGAETTQDYYTPKEAYSIISTVLHEQNIKPGKVLFHGFSRGATNTYAVTALDRQSGNNYFGITIANAGSTMKDYPPTKEIIEGKFGNAPFKGTRWMFFCGGKDQNPNRDGCPAMKRTQKWIEQLGGKTELFIQDENAGHGGFQRNSKNVDKAMKTADTLLKP